MAAVTEISRDLNLVIPMDDPKSPEAFIFCRPLSVQAFRAHYLLLTQTFTALQEAGVIINAPAIAALMLRDIAERAGASERAESLLTEIRRVARYERDTPDGWQAVPVDGAISRGEISEAAWQDVENTLVFFIAASAIAPAEKKKILLAYPLTLRGVRLVSQSSTEYRASLRTSTEAESSGETAEKP